ncbi:MAG: hypothetical protein ACI9G1_000757 [Pirellulaceae bacterium]|jgi:hypothetical protein
MNVSRTASAIVWCALVAVNGFLFGETSAERSLTTCLEAAADLTPVLPTDKFFGQVREVNAVFSLAETETVREMTADYIAVDVGTAAPENFKITSTKLQLQGKKTGRFNYSQPGPMPPGKYRLDVLADGKPWASHNFSVQPNPVLKPFDAEQLFVTTGEVSRNYDFVLRAGKGVKLTLGNIEPDADGALRAKVTVVSRGVEPMGNVLHTLRNGELVLEEWYQWTADGLVVNQRKVGERVLRMTPPQLLLDRSLKTKQWVYRPETKQPPQSVRQWGPVEVPTPSGSELGFVVFTVLDMGITKTTVERHYVPGKGLIREVSVAALRDKRMSRQELILSAD